MEELTDLEKILLDDLRYDQFIMECGETWTKFFLEDCSLDTKKARGVLSSLEKKGIIKMKTVDHDSVIELLKKD